MTNNLFQNIFLAVPYWLSRMTVYSEISAH